MSGIASSYGDHFPDRIRNPLRNMYRRAAGKRILDRLATLNESVHVVKVEELEDLPMLGRTDIIEQLRKLSDSMGFGTFKTGRKGHSSRFEAFPYSLRDIGQFAISLSRTQAAAQANTDSAVPDSRDDQKSEEIEAGGETHSLEHRFVLRPDYSVDLRLPKDLTNSEAQRLSEYVKTLPFH